MTTIVSPFCHRFDSRKKPNQAVSPFPPFCGRNLSSPHLVLLSLFFLSSFSSLYKKEKKMVEMVISRNTVYLCHFKMVGEWWKNGGNRVDYPMRGFH
jgi:hypothetical protein